MKNILYSFIFFSYLFSQNNQEFVLDDVKVEGNIIASSNTIIFTSGLRKGSTVSSTEFPRAIKRLWQLGLFDDVQIRYDDENGQNVGITIVVKESDIIGDIVYEGNRKIKDSKFKEELELVTGQRIKPSLIHEKKLILFCS